ncbi:MAG: DUF433 domain-containing protein [Anaerolineae bacterium]|nr:DUF433 domain-containing protein [Anaerolineae bacterium]
MVGKPVIAGTRLTVAYVLGLFVHRASSEEIEAEYQDLTQEDIQRCFLFASKSPEMIAFLPLLTEPT